MLHGVLIDGKITVIECEWLHLEEELKRRNISMTALAFSSETSERFEMDKRIYQEQHRLDWV